MLYVWSETSLLQKSLQGAPYCQVIALIEIRLL
jgi:hypothetical protein